MKNVRAIIEVLGGMDTLRQNPISLRVPAFMPLSIEVIGRGPRGGILLSVMHWFEQNGDLMRDPDIEVEIVPESAAWLPVSYRQDSLGIFQEAVVVVDGQMRENTKLVRDLLSFMEMWDENIGDQGFAEAAKMESAAREVWKW